MAKALDRQLVVSMPEKAPAKLTDAVQGLIAAAPSGHDFYTFFYTAGRYRLVRSATDRYVECAKPQHRGTKRDTTGPGEGLS